MHLTAPSLDPHTPPATFPVPSHSLDPPFRHRLPQACGPPLSSPSQSTPQASDWTPGTAALTMSPSVGAILCPSPSSAHIWLATAPPAHEDPAEEVAWLLVTTGGRGGVDEATPQAYSEQLSTPVPTGARPRSDAGPPSVVPGPWSEQAIMEDSWTQSPRTATTSSGFATSPWLLAMAPQPILRGKQPHPFGGSRPLSAWLLCFRAPTLSAWVALH